MFYSNNYYQEDLKNIISLDIPFKNFEGKNKPSEEILYYNRYQNWYIKSELAKANKTDFYNNKKVFEKNMDKIKMM